MAVNQIFHRQDDGSLLTDEDRKRIKMLKAERPINIGTRRRDDTKSVAFMLYQRQVELIKELADLLKELDRISEKLEKAVEESE